MRRASASLDRWSTRAARLAPVSQYRRRGVGVRCQTDGVKRRRLEVPAHPGPGDARVEHFHKRLAEISDRMRVSGIGEEK